MNWPCRQVSRPWIYGHRGLRDRAAENTLTAFELALAQGADGIEFDVRPNHEGAVVVFHDETLQRMSGGRDCRRLFDVSRAELSRVQLLKEGAIPSLQEVLQWAAGRDAFLNIELKRCGDADQRLAAAVVDEIEHWACNELRLRILLSSFSPRICSWIEVHAPKLPFARLIDPQESEPGTFVRGNAEGVHPHFTQVDYYRRLADPDSRSFVNVWTVNDAATAQRLDALGVDGLITDQPGLIRSLFA